MGCMSYQNISIFNSYIREISKSTRKKYEFESINIIIKMKSSQALRDLTFEDMPERSYYPWSCLETVSLQEDSPFFSFNSSEFSFNQTQYETPIQMEDQELSQKSHAPAKPNCPLPQKNQDFQDQVEDSAQPNLQFPSSTEEEESELPKGAAKKKKIHKEQKGRDIAKEYKKNICGYVTKRIAREAIRDQYDHKILEIIKSLDIPATRDIRISFSEFIQDWIPRITGVTHLQGMTSVHSTDSTLLVCHKKIFAEFYIWFLQERYLRYLLTEGKMDNKKAYIEYKNSVMLYLVKSERCISI